MNGTLKYLEDHKIKDPICQKIQGRISEITSADNEETTLRSVAVALTLASYSITPEHEKEVLVFAGNTASRLHLDVGVRDSGPHLVGFFASRETAQRLVAGDETTEMNKGESIDIPLSPRLICAGVFQQLHEQDENENDKLSRSGLDDAGGGSSSIQKCQLYLLCLSRLRPASCLQYGLQYGLMITSNSFTLLSVGLSKRTVWEEVSWKSESCVQKLCACVKLIQDEALRPVHPASPKLVTVLSVDARTGEATIESGSSHWPSQNNQEDIRVFKHSWYSKTRDRQEHDFFDKLGDAPGVVHVDRRLSVDCLETDEVSGKSRSLLVPTTVAYPLGACGTVLQFLEAMYDLLEVLRYLVQEENIIHQDVSWANVLINSADHREEDEKVPRKYVVFTSAKDETIALHDKAGGGIPHKYRFISDIFGENKRRVRVVLADFDHGSDLSADNVDDQKNRTGTPMFMAIDVLNPRKRRYMRHTKPAYLLMDTTVESVLGKCEEKYADDNERAVWDNFYESVEHLTWSYISKSIDDDDKLVRSFRHGAVHDAESVFYICILFFVRMWPFDETIKETDREALKTSREELFEKLLLKTPGKNVNLRDILDALPARSDWSPRLSPFFAMLQTIGDYLEIPWYNVASTRRGERYEFHLHDFMQRLLLKEIKQIREGGDHVKPAEEPLSVRTCAHLLTHQFSEVTTSPIEPQDVAEDLDYPRSEKREMLSTGYVTHAAVVGAKEEDSISKGCDGIKAADSHSDGLVASLNRPEATSPKAGEAVQFPKTFWEIYRWKLQEKSWFSSHRLYD